MSAAKDTFDLVVIGSGPAGEKGAAQAAFQGKRVAMVELRSDPGGIALASAGIPTKALRESAIHLSGLGHRAQDLPLGWLKGSSALGALTSRKDEVGQAMVKAVRRNITRHGIELVQGRGKLAGDVESADGKRRRRVEVELPNNGVRSLEADVVLLATGSRPLCPPELAIEDRAVYHSDNVLEIADLPASLVVLGGGAVGCEYASLGATLGVKVTLITRGERLLPRMDVEASRVLAESFNGIGIRVIPKTHVASVERTGDELTLTLENGKKLPAAAVLVATGRRACTDGLGLEAAGVARRSNGDIEVDEHFATSAPGVYAAGDVIGPPGLASTSMEQGRVAMCHAFDFAFKTRVDAFCPTYVFSIPEVAAVGRSEEEVRSAGIAYEVGRASFSANAKALISGFPDGFIKLIFRTEDKALLGVHIVGEQASELIHIGQLLLHQADSIDRLIDTTFAVPTRSDAYKYAAYDGLMRLSRARAKR